MALPRAHAATSSPKDVRRAMEVAAGGAPASDTAVVSLFLLSLVLLPSVIVVAGQSVWGTLLVMVAEP